MRNSRFGLAIWLVCASVPCLLACGRSSEGGLTCGAGTRQQGDECVADESNSAGAPNPPSSDSAGRGGTSGSAESGGAAGVASDDGNGAGAGERGDAGRDTGSGGAPGSGGQAGAREGSGGAPDSGGQAGVREGGEAGRGTGGSDGDAGADGGSEGGESGAPGTECTPGELECACGGNDTCDAGLICRMGRCRSVPEPPTAVVEGHFELSPGFFDVALDVERMRLFASYGGDGVVEVLDLDDGEVTIVETGYRAEHLFFDPDRDEVLVSLPIQDHSAYWFDGQEGYVGAIDAITLADPEPIWIPLDPWDIVGDGRGHAITTGASGQWTEIVSVNLNTGWYQAAHGPYDGTVLQIHPARDRVYAADTGLSPSDIERYNLSIEGEVTSAYDSPYHGDYPMCGDLRVHPGGDTIYTRCGHIFLASNSQQTDMTHVASLGLTWRDLAFDASGRYAFVLTDGARALYIYDTETLAPGGSVSVEPADRILSGPDYFILLRQLARGAVPYTDVEVLRFEAAD